jgi:hypothetical protein
MPLPTTTVAPSTGPVNRVTLFSNGMGHFERVFHVPAEEPLKVSISFNKDHIADALESLTVLGRVRYAVPPSYTPTNAADPDLGVDPTNVTVSLLRSLSGAAFSYRLSNERASWDGDDAGWHRAVLMGAEVVNVLFDKTAVPETFISVMTDQDAISRVKLTDVAAYRFDEPAVRSEIEKAIKANFQKIKPDSTFLDFSLASTTESAETVIVAYKVPLAAWKIRYNIRQNDSTVLDGAALVDNNTDEDWTDTYVVVVTGNPISFSSPDLAEVNEPERQVVHIVDAAALGHVGAEEALETVGAGGGGAKAARLAAAARSMAAPMAAGRAYSSASNRADFGLMAEVAAAEAMDVAEAPGVEAREVGDFSVFTSREPVTIKAKRSAVVPMFQIGLATSGMVLLYKEASHPRRPFRAIKFKSEATHDLGKGKAGIYTDGVYQGEAILETTKPGENRLLPFCLENGVRIVKSVKPQKDKVTRLWFAKGYGYEERRRESCTTYSVTNKKDEEFKVLIEHTSQLPNAPDPPVVTGADVKEVEKITGGYRIYLTVTPKQEVKIGVTETYVEESNVALAHNYNWVHQNVINPKNPLSSEPAVQKCIEIQEEIGDNEREIKDLKESVSSLDEDISRLRENIAAVKEEAGTAATRTAWVKELDGATKSITEIKRQKLPEREAMRKQLAKTFYAALMALQASWTA